VFHSDVLFLSANQVPFLRHSRRFVPARFIGKRVVVVHLPIGTCGCSPGRRGWRGSNSAICGLGGLVGLLLVHGLCSIVLLLRHSVLLVIALWLLSWVRVATVGLVSITTLVVSLLLISLLTSILISGSIWRTWEENMKLC
jgi:hypothetical protein